MILLLEGTNQVADTTKRRISIEVPQSEWIEINKRAAAAKMATNQYVRHKALDLPLEPRKEPSSRKLIDDPHLKRELAEKQKTQVRIVKVIKNANSKQGENLYKADPKG